MVGKTPSITLPEGKKDCEEALKGLLATSEPLQASKTVSWWVTYWYLRGVRDFVSMNYTTGEVKIAYHDKTGHLNFRYEEVLQKVQTELGRLLGIDNRPKANRKQHSLDSVRKTSAAQVLLDSIITATSATEAKLDILIPLLLYGTVGLTSWTPKKKGKADEGPAMPYLQVVAPWELLPIPAEPLCASELKGMHRKRWVTTDWLKEMGIEVEITPDMDVRRSKVGAAPSIDSRPNANSPAPVSLSRVTSASDNDKTTKTYVKLLETWIRSESGHLARYVTSVSGKIVNDLKEEDLVDEETGNLPPFPVAVIKYFDVGGFYGRAFVEPLISVNQEVETMLQALFVNVQELDLLGFLAIPTNSGLDETDFEVTGRPKVVRYEVDYAAPEQKPFTLGPSNAGTLPWKVAEVGIGLMDRLSGHSELLKGDAPGRVDSASALGFMFETSNIPIGGPSTSIALAFGKVFSSMLWQARKNWDAEYALHLTALDNSMAGINVDPATGGVSLDKKGIPDPEDVDITVMSVFPASPEQQKSELKEMLKLGIIDPRDFRIQARRQGLGMPVGNEIEWAAYQRAVLENLVLFGDGEEPGEIQTTDMDPHDIHLWTLDAFMQRPEFRMASEAIRRAFRAHRMAHMEGKGTYPGEMGYPEDEAEIADGGGVPQSGGMPGMPPEIAEMMQSMGGGDEAAAAQMMGGGGPPSEGPPA